MRILVCIDDTDNLESRGTGELATLIAQGIEANHWGSCQFVTRHQLYVHPDIPYTSHNSAMCFAADISPDALPLVTDYASRFLERESAEGSDPGLCVTSLEHLDSPDRLISFGKEAKRTVLTKGAAYSLATELGVHLSEHGGDGQGVIGALAGAGLRLSGNDGRMKGGLAVPPPDGRIRVAALLSAGPVEEVRDINGGRVAPEDLVIIVEKAKTVLLDGRSVLLVTPGQELDGKPFWKTIHRQLLKKY